jgi:tetratricopeptide (TPR) repeat protein
MPQTAEEKAKLLNDLYAHLATAEDEQAAKPIAETIERLWLYSGSDTINLLMERSAAALAAKNSELALKLLDNVVALAPDYAEGFNRRAYVMFSQNNLESAVGDLRRALALEPNHFKALDGLFQIWREHGNKRGALRVVKQLLEVNPNWPGAKQAVEELTREVEGQGI